MIWLAIVAKARALGIDPERISWVSCRAGSPAEWTYEIRGAVPWTVAREIAKAGQAACEDRVAVVFSHASWDGRACRITGDPGPAWGGAAPVYPPALERAS